MTFDDIMRPAAMADEAKDLAKEQALTDAHVQLLDDACEAGLAILAPNEVHRLAIFLSGDLTDEAFTTMVREMQILDVASVTLVYERAVALGAERYSPQLYCLLAGLLGEAQAQSARTVH